MIEGIVLARGGLVDESAHANLPCPLHCIRSWQATGGGLPAKYAGQFDAET